jgi:hypothetical protein
MTHGLLFNVVERRDIARSLGIYRIAHYLREQNLDIEVIDYANYWSLDELKELFRSRYNRNTTFVGFGHLFSTWCDTLEQFCQWIKSNYAHIKIISGSSVNPMFDSAHIDYYVQGYGEHAIDALLKYIVGNGAAPRFNLMLSGGKKVIDAIHSYPAFPMKNLMVKYQDRDFIDSQEWLGVEFARGCKFNCHFCNFPVLGVKGDYTRDSEDFREQMTDAYERFGVTNYYVADETFNDRTEKITKFADVVQTLPFTPWFTGYIRPDLLVNRPLDRQELLRMNFLGHYYGVETFNVDSGKAIGKGMNTDRLLSGILDVKQFFKTSGSGQYRGTISIIVGLPHDTVDSLRFTRQWLIDNWNDQSFVTFFLMIPTDPAVKASLISSDYEKYGYREMPKESIAKYSLTSDTVFKNTNDALIWENQNMNIFEADKIVSDLVDVKYTHNFTVSTYGLSHRLRQPLSVEDRLKVSSAEWRYMGSVDHVQEYIHKKLSL